MASKRRKGPRASKKTFKKQKIRREGFQAINGPVIATMALPRSPPYEDNIPASAKPRIDGAPDYEDKGQTEIQEGLEQPEAETPQADIQEATKTQDAETQDVETQDADSQGTEVQDPAPQPVGWRQERQQLTEADLPNRTKKRSSTSKRTREIVTLARDAGQEDPYENDSALGAQSIPEQIRFFDVQFNNVSKGYKITRLREDIRDWHDLKPISTFTTQNETFRRGDLVHIKLHD